MTRAKSALIVIGDSRTLQNERHWRAFVEWCKAENCYVSSPLKPEVLSTLYASARPPVQYIPPIARTGVSTGGGNEVLKMSKMIENMIEEERREETG